MTMVQSTELPVIGREREQKLFRTHLQEVENGQNAFLLLAGEGGSGKTCMLQHFTAQAEQRNWQILVGQCDERARENPYQPFFTTLGLCFDKNGQIINDRSVTSIVDQIPMDDVISAMSNIPALGAVIALGIIGKNLFEQRRRPAEDILNRNFEFIRRVLEEIYRKNKTPILLSLDDLQCASTTTYALLEYVLTEAVEMRILIIGSWRTDSSKTRGGEAPAPIPPELRSLGTVWPLNPLSMAETRRLVSVLSADESIPARLGRDIYKLSHGLPGLIVESVELIQTEGQHVFEPAAQSAEGDLPDDLSSGLDILVGRSLRSLPDEARSILECAAAVGQRFPAMIMISSPMQDYLGMNERKILKTLTDLAETGQVLSFDVGDTLQFTSHYLYTYLGRKVSPLLARRDHLRIAQSLEEVEGATTPGELAHHFFMGGDYQKTLTYSLRSAEALTRDAAYPEALGSYKLALQALDKLPESEETREPRVDILIAMSFILEQTGRWEEAITYLEEALSFDQTEARVAEIQGGLGWLRFKRGEIQAALEHLAISAESYRRLGDARGQAQIDYYRGAIYSQQKEWQQAIACFDAHIQTSLEIGFEEGLALVYLELGNLYRLQRSWEQAEEYLKKGLKKAEEDDDQYALVQGYHYLGVCYGRQVKPEAIEFLAKALDIARDRLKQPHQEAIINNTLAETYVRLNRWEEAVEAFKASEQLKLQLGDRAGLAMTYGGLGRLYHRQWRFDLASEYYQKDLEVLEEERQANIAWIQQITNSLGEVHRLAGRLGRAETCFRQALTLAGSIPDEGERDRSRGYSYLGLTKLSLDQHDLKAAREHYQQAEKLLKHSWMEPETKWVRAQLERLSQNWDEALFFLTESLEAFERSGEDYDRMQVYYEMALLCQARGDSLAAQSWFEKTLQAADNLSNMVMRDMVMLNIS
jgi:tetratricopeptide (TPR) repeat protein